MEEQKMNNDNPLDFNTTPVRIGHDYSSIINK
jgi:hypothetical protein